MANDLEKTEILMENMSPSQNLIDRLDKIVQRNQNDCTRVDDTLKDENWITARNFVKAAKEMRRLANYMEHKGK